MLINMFYLLYILEVHFHTLFIGLPVYRNIWRCFSPISCCYYLVCEFRQSSIHKHIFDSNEERQQIYCVAFNPPFYPTLAYISIYLNAKRKWL